MSCSLSCPSPVLQLSLTCLISCPSPVPSGVPSAPLSSPRRPCLGTGAWLCPAAAGGRGDEAQLFLRRMGDRRAGALSLLAAWTPALLLDDSSSSSILRWTPPSSERYLTNPTWNGLLPSGPYHAACGILVPGPRIGPAPSAVELRISNHWAAREVPFLYYKKVIFCCFIRSLLSFSSPRFTPRGLLRILGCISYCGNYSSGLQLLEKNSSF
ncbi:uncharacterized protein [Pseudorca crassidens]|uniref:uncharacterized protein n=1 Tax=Pseudorca crassidens TaxID=82174 RepID=UPI00352F640B